MKNDEVAEIFRSIAMILELQGANPFRIRAYERAAQNVESLGDELENLVKKDKLTDIPGVGTDLADKIKEIVKTGKLTYYNKLKKEIPSGLLSMMEIPGLGPKTVKLIYKKLKIDSVKKLEDAAKKGKLKGIEGIREKTEENILRGISLIKKGAERTPLYTALSIADSFIEKLKKVKQIEEIEAAGSLRRRKETVRDIDILVISKNAGLVMKKFTGLEMVKEVVASGGTKSSVISRENMQVDLRVLDKSSFGSALLYFTGSKAFNIKLRQLAVKRGLKINEYGVFSVGKRSEKRLAGSTEEEIFSLMKMAYIPPELREDRGEIDAALKNKLPKLIELKDIKGDFHVHSTYSDGNSKIEEIAHQAKKIGYKYIGICDHSQSLKVANGLTPKEVHKKIEEVKKVNKKVKGIKVLCGTEVDISGEGELDYPDSLLKEFDLVVAAIHSGFKQSRQQLTKRIVSACKNKYVNIIAHLTGKLWGTRDPYDVDLDAIIKACCDHKVALEINCFPQRLDLSDINAMKAKEAGVKLALGTDAHMIEQLAVMDLGVSVARRAWLEQSDVINCMDKEKLLKWLKK